VSRGSTGTERLAALAALFLVAACGSSPELVRRPARPPSALVFQDTSVLDVESGTRQAHRDVVVVGERIAAITPTGSTAAPAGAQVIAAAGTTLLPGLIDTHTHTDVGSAPPWRNEIPDPDANLRAFLYCGVTTVLDAGGLTPDVLTRRDRIRAGTLLGPTMYAAGPQVTAPGGHPLPLLRQLVPWWIRWYVGPRLTRQVSSAGEAQVVVDELAGLGVDFVKFMVDSLPPGAPRISRETLEAGVAEARRHGLRAVAHIGTVEDALDAGRAGVAAWMHNVYKERIPDEVVPQLAAFRIPMVATLVVFETYATLGRETRAPTPLERETVAKDVLADFDRVPPGFDFHVFDEALAGLRSMRSVWRDNVRRLRAAGVVILAGSDEQAGVFPGAGLHRELHLLTEAGLTPADAIRAATLDAARFLAGEAEPDFGRVAVGQRADLLLVEGDPTADLDALMRIRAVVRGGLILERRPVSPS
jgi:imidazolonepropionase-like amidohydrolase